MSEKKKIKILHIVKWFYAGGAERLLSSVLSHSDRNEFDHVILSLSDEGERLAKIQDRLGIPYTSIHMEREKRNTRERIQCFNFIRKEKPDIIKCWLPPANRTGAIIGKMLNKPVIWGIHDSKPHREDDKKHLMMSKFLVNKIVCCSKAVENVCLNIGYNPKMLNVILNGTDTDFFKPIRGAKKNLCKELGIKESSLLIGMAAEYSFVKRHDNFLEAAKIFLNEHPDTYFILCGKNINSDNQILKDHIKKLGIENNVKLLDIRDDMPEIFSAFDINTLNSSNESFGLSITEAMACETFCVATNTGLMPNLLDNAGIVIEISDDPKVLYKGWKYALKIDKSTKTKMVKLARQRIVNDYSIKETAKKYDDIFRSMITKK